MRRVKRVMGLALAVMITGYLFIHISYMYRGYDRLMCFYGVEKNTLDVVFVGTSVTFSSFMPMEAWGQYGMAACDYCTNVQFENSLRYSIREIEKTQNPQLIMIDIAPFYFNHYAGIGDDLYIKYNLDSMKYSFDRARLTKEINDDKGGDLYSYLYYFFDIVRYHTNKPTLKQYNNALNDPGRGYGYLQRNSNAVDVDTLVEDDGKEVPLADYQQKYLQELIAEVDKLECDVVFFCAPVLFANIDYVHWKNYIGRIVSEAGYPFWDMSKDVQSLELDYNTDFWSCDHYDCLGAEKSTAYIAKRIKENYNIPDRRKDPDYSNWHEDYKEWQNIKESYKDRDFGFCEAESFDEFFNILGDIKYDAVIEILDPTIMDFIETEQLEEIGITKEQILGDTDFLLIKGGDDTTVLKDAHFSENVYDTILGEFSIFYDESGEYEVYLNGEECITVSAQEPDADIRIRVFKDNNLSKTIYYASFKLGQEENPLGIVE